MQAEPTNQQKKVIFLLSMGYSAKRAAHQMGISQLTVQGHIASAKQRVDVVNTPALVAMALRKGWIQ